jgi:hypothetical protein
MCLPELSVKKTDKLRPFLNFQPQVTSSYFKFLVIARRHPYRNHPKLSWKSKSCVNQPSILVDQKQNRWRFNFSPPPADPFIPNFKERTSAEAQYRIIPP